MKTDLLASKLYFPSRRQNLVQRPRLFESLDAGLSGKLTLVSAPAGFGKTTVVSEWIREGGHPTAWLSLDKNDNDPSRFLIYLVSALQCIDAEVGVEIRAVLEESMSPHFEILLTRLIREMDRFPGKSIIVLDDYHLIHSKPVHDVINFLVEYMPPTIHLVICGRADPPLPLSRLRIQGDVNEVRTSQLRFTKNEVTTYLNELMGFDLSSDGIAALEARTEGWVASLKLAALSMQGLEDRSTFITEFSGSNRFVIDYLVDEVMARQTEEVQAFLRRTSILERFCAPLSEYIGGEGKDSEIIAYLDRSNLFLIPLDDRRMWYRYHHLFADFLRQKLHTSGRDTIPALHRRASQWYENQGLVDEAVQHALAAGEFESAIRLVEQVAADLVVRRESNRLLNLIDKLPPDHCQNYPMLCVWHAWAFLFLGQLEAVEPILQIIESNQRKALEAPISGYITTVRSYLASLKGSYHKALALAEQAIDMMSDVPPERITPIFRGAAVIWLGVNHRILGDLDRARELFTEAARLNQEAGSLYAALASFEQLAKLAVIRGELHQALDIYRSGLKIAQHWMDKEGKPQGFLIAAAGPQLGLGTVLYQLNDLAGAAAPLQHSVDLLELGELYGSMNAYKMLAYLRQAQGEFEAAIVLYRKACDIERGLIVQQPSIADFPSLTKLAVILSRTRPEMAYLLTDAAYRFEKLGVHTNDEVDFSSPAGYPYELKYSDLACLLIALGRAAEALPLLTRLLQAAITMERRGDEIHYLVHIAMAHQSLGNMQAALHSLGQALTLAEPQGYVRLFVDEGQPMAELLIFAVSQMVAPDYAGKLLAAFPEDLLSSVPFDQDLALNTQGLVEPLTEREIEVLLLMTEGYKYQEIAERLVVSINTVRHHTRNLYSKLEVNNRTQALGRARDLNLL